MRLLRSTFGQFCACCRGRFAAAAVYSLWCYFVVGSSFGGMDSIYDIYGNFSRYLVNVIMIYTKGIYVVETYNSQLPGANVSNQRFWYTEWHSRSLAAEEACLRGNMRSPF